MQKFNTQQMNEAVNEAYEKFRGDDGGKNADYIPFLANVPSQLFGISVCLPDGEIVEAGDTDYVFGIESVSKVPTAVLAMQQYGPDTVLDQIGADATGLPFNSIMAILLENDHPSTPLVNAGAIAACSMVKPVGDASGKWKAITDFLEKLCGSPLVLQDELQVGVGNELQQPLDRMAAEELRSHLRRPGHVARHLYPSVLHGRDGPPTVDLRRHDRQPRGQSGNARAGVRCGDYAEDRLDDRYGGLLRAYGRLDFLVRHSGQDRRGRRDRRRAARRDGHRGVFSQGLDGSGNSVRAQHAIKYITNKLGLNLFG